MFTSNGVLEWTTDKQEMYLAIENQLVEDLTMPYRNAMYDMKSYESQIRRLKRNHRETRDLETIKKRYRQKIDKEVVMMICALT